MSVHLLVQVEDLPAWRIRGLYCALMQLPGVLMVTDLETTSRETLDIMLMPSHDGLAAPKPRRRKKAAA